MNFTILNCEQRSPEWFAARAGRLTGSAAKDMLATVKSGEAAGRVKLRTRLMLERLTLQPQEDGYTNKAMQWGIDHEPDALAAYESITGDLVTHTGFLSHNELLAGCSLDGHLGDFETLVSLKCPESHTHLNYILSGEFPSDYVPQMLHELWITDAQHYDFLSFDPRFPDPWRTFYVRVERNEAQVQDYAAKAVAFLQEVDRKLDELQQRSNVKQRLLEAAGVA